MWSLHWSQKLPGDAEQSYLGTHGDKTGAKVISSVLRAIHMSELNIIHGRFLIWRVTLHDDLSTARATVKVMQQTLASLPHDPHNCHVSRMRGCETLMCLYLCTKHLGVEISYYTQGVIAEYMVVVRLTPWLCCSKAKENAPQYMYIHNAMLS